MTEINPDSEHVSPVKPNVLVTIFKRFQRKVINWAQNHATL